MVLGHDDGSGVCDCGKTSIDPCNADLEEHLLSGEDREQRSGRRGARRRRSYVSKDRGEELVRPFAEVAGRVLRPRHVDQHRAVVFSRPEVGVGECDRHEVAALVDDDARGRRVVSDVEEQACCECNRESRLQPRDVSTEEHLLTGFVGCLAQAI